jgi:hypothetical protein
VAGNEHGALEARALGIQGSPVNRKLGMPGLSPGCIHKWIIELEGFEYPLARRAAPYPMESLRRHGGSFGRDLHPRARAAGDAGFKKKGVTCLGDVKQKPLRIRQVVEQPIAVHQVKSTESDYPLRVFIKVNDLGVNREPLFQHIYAFRAPIHGQDSAIAVEVKKRMVTNTSSQFQDTLASEGEAKAIQML